MPIPSPKGKETKQKFISRCMGNDSMKKEFPKQKQRAGVCYSQWREAKKSRGEEITIEDYSPFEVQAGKFEADQAAERIVKELKPKKKNKKKDCKDH